MPAAVASSQASRVRCQLPPLRGGAGFLGGVLRGGLGFFVFAMDQRAVRRECGRSLCKGMVTEKGRLGANLRVAWFSILVNRSCRSTSGYSTALSY